MLLRMLERWCKGAPPLMAEMGPVQPLRVAPPHARTSILMGMFVCVIKWHAVNYRMRLN